LISQSIERGAQGDAIALNAMTDSVNELADCVPQRTTSKEIDDMVAFADATNVADEATANLKAQWDEIFAAKQSNPLATAMRVDEWPSRR